MKAFFVAHWQHALIAYVVVVMLFGLFMIAAAKPEDKEDAGHSGGY